MRVTGRGIPWRDMRLLHHGGQGLLVLVVAGLSGAVAVGVAMECFGLPAPIANRAAGVLASPRSSLPAQIEIHGNAPPDVPAAATEATPAVSAAPGASPPASAAAEPTPTTAVVPNNVYTWGHGGGGGGGSGRRGGG